MNAHIIIHKNYIGLESYIRIVSVPKVSVYFDELEKAYGITVEKDENNLRVFYNHSEFYDRLLHDLKFKRFKNTVMYEKCQGLWKIETKVDNIEWWTMFISWINNKLKSYIEDQVEDETYLYINPTNENLIKEGCWSLTCCNHTMNMTTYVVNDIEKTTENDMYVLTKSHILGLMLDYINTNQGGILLYVPEWPEIDKEKPEGLIVEYCENKRGVLTNKRIFEKRELHYIFSKLNINAVTLNSIFTHDTYKKSLNTTQVDPLPSYCKKTDPWYSFIDEKSLEKTLHDIETVFDQTQLLYISSPDLVKMEDSSTWKKILYKNTLNNRITVLEQDLGYIYEMKKLSELNYNTEITRSFLESLNEQRVSKESIKELYELLYIIENEKEYIGESEPNMLDWSKQKIATKEYVDLYKNDERETLASVVIDHVYDYLSRQISRDQINKNQIGVDLVDLGVKKTRKSKGYVYGMNCENNNTLVDMDKVSKSNYQLRPQPIPVVDESVFHFSCPGKYVVPP